MSQEFKNEVDDILRLLNRGYHYLFERAKRKGHWDEARSTALAAICVAKRIDGESKWLEAIASWIRASQQTTEDVDLQGSWGEEVWDTAMCVLALQELRIDAADSIQRALEWIAQLYSKNGRGNWHDEPWETCWALIALLRGAQLDAVNKWDVDLGRAIDWLMDLDQGNGQIVAPHYTAYLVYIEQLSGKWPLKTAVRERLSTAKDKAAEFLIASVSDPRIDTLWTGEAWSNGQILWCLCETGKFPVSDPALLRRTIDWFRRDQDESSGKWSDVEDTASAVIGLLYLLRAVIDHRSSLLRWPPEYPGQEYSRLLQDKVIVPRKLSRLGWIERDATDGCLSVHISQSTQWIVGFVAAVISTIAALLAIF